MKRVQWVDWCKGIGILLVLLGHTLRTDVSLVYVYGFHMPLFFFLSGLVCNEKKYNWKSFLKSRFNTLIIPYIVFYLLTWLYWLFIERSVRPIDLSWWQPLVGMVYGAQWHGLMDHNGIPALSVHDRGAVLCGKSPGREMEAGCCSGCFGGRRTDDKD